MAFGLAVAVKLLPIVLLPLYWKWVRLRDAALAGIVVGLLYVPFLNHGRVPIGSLGTYVERFRFNDPVFATLERIAAPQVVVVLALLAGFITAIWVRSKLPMPSFDAFPWPMAATLLFAPVVYPWYLLWLLPLLRSPAMHAYRRVDGLHYPHLHRLAFTHCWATMGGSCLDHAIGVRIRGSSGRNYGFAPVPSIDRPALFRGPCRVKPTTSTQFV
jgi:hypothetical protein